MKKAIMGGLMGLAILCYPVNVYAESAESTVIEVSYEDAQLLLKVAQAEAGNQGFVGQWLIMCTVMNRVESEDFPDTVKGVIYQEGQFATATNGAMNKAVPTAETHEALAYLESGNKAENIVAFEGAGSDYLERYFWRAFTFRDHTFYTLNK